MELGMDLDSVSGCIVLSGSGNQAGLTMIIRPSKVEYCEVHADGESCSVTLYMVTRYVSFDLRMSAEEATRILHAALGQEERYVN